MKRFNIPFTIAFAISVLVLAAAYADGESRPDVVTEGIRYDSLQELNELCRLKYRQSRRYEEYARHAASQRNPDIAALFVAMSRADAIQCTNCRKVIESLGGKFYVPVIAPVRTVSICEHLNGALRDKIDCHRNRMARCIDCAVAEGNRNMARILTWCDASDVRQIAIIRRELDRLNSSSADGRASRRDGFYGVSFGEVAGASMHHALYGVCPKCGNVTESDGDTRYCPHCMTEGYDFAAFE